MTNKCFKIKNGVQTRIPASKCTKKEIDRLNKKGYAVSKSIEKGHVTKIVTYSALTKEQSWEQRKKLYQGISGSDEDESEMQRPWEKY